MGPPKETPIGLQLARAAKTVGRAFDDALADAGGSQAEWLVLVSLKANRTSTQRQLADTLGLREPTVTHHLNTMEAAGLVTRQRDPDNRRTHQLLLTDEGEARFMRLRTAAGAFDQRLRSGLTDAQITELRNVLDQLVTNVSES